MRIKLNVPNILTLFRILLVPVAIILVFNDKMISAFVIYIIACLTDVLDGIIARTYNLVTDAGKFLDPLADKIMGMSMVISFTILKIFPWFICAFFVAKELIMIIGGLVLYNRKIVISANIFGKISAIFFHIAIIFTFLYETIENVYLYLIYLAVAFAFASLIQYAYLNSSKFKKDSNDHSNDKDNFIENDINNNVEQNL